MGPSDATWPPFDADRMAVLQQERRLVDGQDALVAEGEQSSPAIVAMAAQHRIPILKWVIDPR